MYLKEKPTSKIKHCLPKIKDGPYILNLDEYKSVGTNWRYLYVNDDNVMYFDSFGVEPIPKDKKKLTYNKNITTIIYRI